MCRLVTIRATAILLGSFLTTFPTQLLAQDGPMRPGEAFVTRFSGIQQSGPQDNPTILIDPNGTVGSIIDIRSPRRPPRGEHWIDEPQRTPVTAAAVGQVFGVALDDANPPNIYLTSTSAFGLHHTPDNRWMPGMWGPGGPGAIYKLTAANGYRSTLFATVTLNGRPNTGPALGNIAYDKANRQFFVSDLETGMIHRFGLDGSPGGFFDHGNQGRASFADAQTGQRSQLPPIAFDPTSRAQFGADCSAPPADNSPECWNFAASGRRIWGLGVRTEGQGRVRLYYSVWSSPTYDPDTWSQMGEEDKRNTVWSIGIGPDGSFAQDVRREFVVPDFFVASEDIARVGYSSPVSDISFPVCSGRPVMLIGERGGIRNLGLAAENAFANPHESRAIRLELDTTGAWRPVGRYDIGFYDRQKDGLPFLRANCAGGVAFGPGYSQSGEVNLSQPDQFVWITGDSLCSVDGPCNQPGGATAAQPAGSAPQPASQEAEGDDSEVHGLQGMSEAAIGELAPAAAYQENVANPNDTPSARGPNEAYLIDTDLNVDASGNPIEAEFVRNDATLIGDVAIYELCQQAPPPQESFALLPAPPPQAPDEPITWAGHPAEISHSQYASHGRQMSHFRWGSHFAVMSHRRWGSHSQYWSHNWRLSGWHNVYWSHWPRLSHRRWGSDRHWRVLSPPHNVYISKKHYTHLSPRHQNWLSPRHVRPLSPGHLRHSSPGHRLPLSPHHNLRLSPGHRQPLSPNHNHILSKQKHRLPLSVNQHNTKLSPQQHKHVLSVRVPGSTPLHNRVLSPQTQLPKHNVRLSPTTKPGHDRHLSPVKPPHNTRLSQDHKKPPHSQALTNQQTFQGHRPQASNAQKTTPPHNVRQSNAQKTTPPHNVRQSNAQKPKAHTVRQSNADKPKAHTVRQSNAQKPKAHNVQQSNAQKPKAHNTRQSNAQKPKAHNTRQSNAQKPKGHNVRQSNAQKQKQNVQKQKQNVQKQKQNVQKQKQNVQKQKQNVQKQKPRQKQHNRQTSRQA